MVYVECKDRNLLRHLEVRQRGFLRWSPELLWKGTRRGGYSSAEDEGEEDLGGRNHQDYAKAS